ncbi:hypothetical protein HDN1F_20370 [gamma proteobacterium HdN1]|nr:hypothetical protein HDN1F_20370 [gamma proteobacterium HdN1]
MDVYNSVIRDARLRQHSFQEDRASSTRSTKELKLPLSQAQSKLMSADKERDKAAFEGLFNGMGKACELENGESAESADCEDAAPCEHRLESIANGEEQKQNHEEGDFGEGASGDRGTECDGEVDANRKLGNGKLVGNHIVPRTEQIGRYSEESTQLDKFGSEEQASLNVVVQGGASLTAVADMKFSSATLDQNQFVALVEKYAERMLMSEHIKPGEVGSQAVLFLKNSAFEKTPIMLEKTATGWLLKANGMSEDAAAKIKRYSPGLVHRFAARGLGQIDIVLSDQLHGEDA